MANSSHPPGIRHTPFQGRLPPGEQVIWTGRPRTFLLAADAMRIRWVAGYFVVMALWRTGSLIGDMPLLAAASAGLPFLVLGILCCLVLLAMAWAQARSATYAITDARVVLQVGAALSLTVNIPFEKIESAELKLERNGSGSIFFMSGGKRRLPYLSLWPHARPWHIRRPEAAFRAIEDASDVAAALSAAREEWTRKLEGASPASATDDQQSIVIKPIAAE